MNNIHMSILDALQELILEKRHITQYDVISETDESAVDLDASSFESIGGNSEYDARRTFLLNFGDFITYKSYIVDNGHENGLVINTVTTSGVVIVANLETKKIITYFAPTPSFLIKKFNIIDVDILEKAKNNVKFIKAFEKKNNKKLKDI
jgi:hypothetical protein